LSFIKLALLVGIVDVFISPPKKFKICKLLSNLLDENQIFTGRFYCSIAVVSYTHFRNTYAEGNNGSVDRQIVKTKFRKVKKGGGRSAVKLVAFDRSILLLLFHPFSIAANVPVPVIPRPLIMLPITHHAKTLFVTGKQLTAVTTHIFIFCKNKSTNEGIFWRVFY
jgi:hypothetical protein